jgi:hypothetical protein
VLTVEGARLARREFGWRGVAKRTAAVIENAIEDFDNRRGIRSIEPDPAA